MKAFVSSLIAGFESYREEAADAAATLGYEVLRAETLSASAGTPQQACLDLVRRSDVVLLVLGERYGAVQGSGLSATHEEYREARGYRPVLVFVQSDVHPEPAQREFLDEVEAWETGHFRATFTTAEELRRAVTRALHEHELAQSSGTVDESELIEVALSALPEAAGMGAEASIAVAISGGPRRQVIRPAELGSNALGTSIQREGMFGPHAVLNQSAATTIDIRRAALVIEQRSASVTLDESGTVCVVQPARRESDRSVTSLPVLIEEDIRFSISNALRFGAWLLDSVDGEHRLTDVVPLVRLTGGGYMGWKTRVENAATPNSATVGSGRDSVTVRLSPARRHRAALVQQGDQLSEDLTTLVRRERES